MKPPKDRPSSSPRSAGLLLHVTSLPGRFGVGDLGPEAHAFVAALARAGQSWWQVLPLGPPAAGASPYQCFSAFAGNPLLISPDLLVRDGLLSKRGLTAASFREGRVDYVKAAEFKRRLLARAHERFAVGAGRTLRPLLARFRREAADWLDDFALFMALRDHHGGRPWWEWPRHLAQRLPEALRDAERSLPEAIERCRFEQFLFFRQLALLRERAREAGVRLLGDLPIYVSADSADVWASPGLFQLDKRGRPAAVAGVPPDLFTADGQRWGNPLYDWDAMRADRFDWWARRLRATLEQVDLVRLDHFRGLEAYWRIPASSPTARRGRWVKAPGRELLEALRRKLGSLPLVAEDLGVITPEVESLRDGFGLPGMKVLQFAFGRDDDPYLPHRHVPNAVAYTGTHDNDTTMGWYASAGRKEKARFHAYAPSARGARGEDAAWTLMRLAWGSVADLAIAPVQDVLSLGSEARMNTPGTAEGNWSWRLRPGQLSRAHLDRLAELTHTYGRGRTDPTA